MYRSRPDGSQMTEVASFSLDFPRGRITLGTAWAYQYGSYGYPHRNLDAAWQPWRDGWNPRRIRGDLLSSYPMPMLTDLGFDSSGTMIIGFRDRRSDESPGFRTDYGYFTDLDPVGFGVGDIVQAVSEDGAWTFDPGREHFDDRVAGFGDETAQGGLAVLPDGGLTVSGAYVTHRSRTAEGAYWFDNDSGNRRQQEQVYDVSGFEPLRSALSPVDRVYADNEGPSLQAVRAPGTVGDMEVLCAPDVEPTATPTDTITPMPTDTTTPTGVPPTATLTPSPQPTAASTDTPTPRPAPIYFPLALEEPPCEPGSRHVDVVLVIDASTSMLDPTAAGRTKLDAAKEAANSFLDQLDASDQVAIVAFNADAWLLQELTSDRAALDSAIVGITSAQQTCIVCAVGEAADELASDRRNPDNTPVLILLTDGKSNPRPVGEAVARAELAKQAGVTIFTIGLGDDLDFGALGRIASKPTYYYHAPDAEELGDIYGAIAVEIPCPVENYWGRR